MSDTVIHVEQLSKSYQYGAISHGTLTTDLQSWWARVRGRNDPNAILTHSARSGQSGQRFWALQDVSFDVKQGKIVGIIGRNGAGQSILLNHRACIKKPTGSQENNNG
jgi:lipopolysaccharide transport system ATP-binding protein